MAKVLFWTFKAFFKGRIALAIENLALRQQLAVYEQSTKRPKLRDRDRIFWVWLSRIWADWQKVLVIVQPETVVKWHRKGFKLYWRWISRRRDPHIPYPFLFYRSTWNG